MKLNGGKMFKTISLRIIILTLIKILGLLLKNNVVTIWLNFQIQHFAAFCS